MKTTTISSKNKSRGKAHPVPNTRAAARRKNIRRPVYVFAQAIKNDNIYKDYFQPGSEVEKRLLKLDDLVKLIRQAPIALLTDANRNLNGEVAGRGMATAMQRRRSVI